MNSSSFDYFGNILPSVVFVYCSVSTWFLPGVIHQRLFSVRQLMMKVHHHDTVGPDESQHTHLCMRTGNYVRVFVFLSYFLRIFLTAVTLRSMNLINCITSRATITYSWWICRSSSKEVMLLPDDDLGGVVTAVTLIDEEVGLGRGGDRFPSLVARWWWWDWDVFWIKIARRSANRSSSAAMDPCSCSTNNTAFSISRSSAYLNSCCDASVSAATDDDCFSFSNDKFQVVVGYAMTSPRDAMLCTSIVESSAEFDHLLYYYDGMFRTKA